MRFITAIFCLSLLLPTYSLQAQKKYLDGFWKGFITTGIVDGVRQGMIFELYLKTEGRSTISGRSYAYREDGEVIEMAVKGQVYSDRSISLEDATFLPLENSGVTPTHNKQYQFSYHRSIFKSDNRLEGFWQEIIETPLAMKRRRGKITLQKVSNAVKKP